MQISFLIHNGYGIGGTIRTTYNLAAQLAEHHDVEVVSVFRHREAPALPPDPRVRVRHLVDLRKDSPTSDRAHTLLKAPATVFPAAEGRHHQYSALTDERIAAFLGSVDSDVVIGTRPGLNVHLARQTRPGPVRVGQEHLTLDTHSPELRQALQSAYPRLDAFTTTTEADARVYRSTMRMPGVPVQAVPNPVPAPGIDPVDGHGKWVVAAGRLAPVKRYDLLVRAFARVREERPDWRLRIYGGGGQRDRLRGLIDELGLYNHVFLMGPAHPIESEWVKGSVAAVTSSMESFGMTIVEAMRCGLPVVSTDCPLGPGEIIEDGVDGRLVPVGDTDAVAAGLLQLINDDELRGRMSRAALKSSQRFDPARIAEHYETLFTSRLSARGKGPGGRLRAALHRGRGSLVGAREAGRQALLRKGRTA
ncbi:glycosyltransferase family 4 protein [Streptomyces sp. NPDC049954]|uniref:glycosyltransferase family 4 protein n=1 Tax=Streptomyces sp. NPDC049954 TaxID=3155779 RepID=UPI00342F4A92